MRESPRRFRPYPQYKDSGVEWLGEIPRHWRTQKLKFTSHIKGRIGWQNLRSDEFTNVGPYLVTGMHFKNGGVDWEACYHITEERYAMAPEIQLREGDVVVTKDGSIGKIAYIDSLPGPASLNSHLLVIRDLRGMYEGRFLYHLLSSDAFRAYALLEQEGTTFFGITQESVEKFPIVLPLLDEQRAIAAFLDRETGKIDALVAKKERVIELLQEKRTALITRAVTKGLDPNVPMKDSGVEWPGKIPAHWEVKKVKHLARILRGKFTHRPRNDPRLYDGPYPFIQTGDVASARKYITEYYRTLNDAGLAVSKEFPAGTLVMTIAANVGDMAILNFNACFPDSVVGFLPEEGVLLPFLYYLMTAMRPELVRASTTNTQANLNIDRIESVITARPPASEQEQIVAHIEKATSRFDALIDKVREAIERLREFRPALISAAVTGKIDVRGEVAS